MQWDVERWLTGRKYLFMISVALVLIAVIGFWLLLPLKAETPAGRSPQVQAQWRKLLPLRSFTDRRDGGRRDPGFYAY